MLDWALIIISMSGTGLLTYMGARVVFDAPQDRGSQRRWLAAFGIVCAVSVGAGIWAAVRSSGAIDHLQATVETLEKIATGGDSFCVLEAEVLRIKNHAPQIFLSIQNRGNVPLREVIVAVSPLDSPSMGMVGYASIGVRRFPIIPANEGFSTGITIKVPQDMHINITASNGTVTQILKVKQDGNLLHQISVTTKGKKQLDKFEKTTPLTAN